MDYSLYHEFPFPSNLSSEEKKLESYFLSLSDEEQLTLLNASSSYETFLRQVSLHFGAAG